RQPLLGELVELATALGGVEELAADQVGLHGLGVDTGVRSLLERAGPGATSVVAIPHVPHRPAAAGHPFVDRRHQALLPLTPRPVPRATPPPGPRRTRSTGR